MKPVPPLIVTCIRLPLYATEPPRGAFQRTSPVNQGDLATRPRALSAASDDEDSQSMRSAPPMANCRSLVNVSGVVTPSPVGVAILKLI